MARTLLVATLVASLASFYQFLAKDLIFNTFGIGRDVQAIEDFPFTCRRLQDKKLEACEDLWLDDDSRTLYAACAGTQHRLSWNQAMGKLNASARRPGGSELVALDIDSPDSKGVFPMRVIKPTGYVGASGDASIDLLGFDAQIVDDTIHFYFVNQRPSVDSNKNLLDSSKIGPNATIDVFEMKRGSSQMKHIRTVWSPQVWSPNRVAVLSDGAFVVTNDHSVKLGVRKELDPIIGGGNVAYCSPSGDCHQATTMRLKFPNGLTKGKDGLIYVPSSVDGAVRVYQLHSDKMLELVDTIHTKIPLDNVSPDAVGDLWVPGFPNYAKGMAAISNPLERESPTTIFRIRKAGESYKVDKVVEDKQGKVLSVVTTVRHDAKTGRLFLGSALKPFLMVCDPK